MKSINWEFISKAINFYKKLGYEYVEVPWIVDTSTNMITIPQGHYSTSISEDESLVGSAEQSFLQLAIENKLKPG